MGPAFEVGDRVFAIATPATHGEVVAVTHRAVSVRWPNGSFTEHAAENLFHAEGVGAPTPAPLDPSKVKAGDTVTLTGPTGRATVTGPVTDAAYVGGGEWDIRIEDTSTYRVGRIGLWAVTDHQPEPEPEWTDGQIGDALVHGASVRGFISNDGESFVFSVPGGGYHEAGHGSFEDFVPLVVIDPAAVDVDALVEVAHHDRVLYGDTTPDQMRRAILRILAHMGIEAP